MVDLILRPSGMARDPRRRWALQLRWHDSYGGPGYATIARVTDVEAQEIIDAGPARFLFDKPADWKAELDQLEPEAMRPSELVAEIHRLRTALRGETAGGWRTMDSAPKDGTNVLWCNEDAISHLFAYVR